MMRKERAFLLLFIACIIVVPGVPAQAADELISPEVFSSFQQQGTQFSRDMRDLETVLSRIRNKKKFGGSLRSELAEFRAQRRNVKDGQKAFMKKLAQMEAALVDSGVDPLFVERHRTMVQKFKEKFGELAERLDREDMDDLLEKGLRVNRHEERTAGKKTIREKALKAAPQSAPLAPQPNIEAITQPEKGEAENPPSLPGDKFGLLFENGRYELVKFSIPGSIQAPALANDVSEAIQALPLYRWTPDGVNHSNPRPIGRDGAAEVGVTQPAIQNPQSKIQISSVAAWDLDLPQSVRPVMVAGLGDMAGLLSQATMCAIEKPLDNDTREDGIDIVFSDEIKALAETLGRDPIKIYEYVKNTIEYKPYWGSLKGAQETLLSKQGNDCDQASLLIALLRCSGYPARYGEAVVTVDIERAKSWLGVESGQMAVNLLFSVGVPDVHGLFLSSQLVQMQFRHIYAEVYLPYENYRGQVRPQGGQKLWVPLSPSFKQHRVIPGIDLAAAVPFDPASLLEGATVGEGGSISGLDPAVVMQKMDAYTARVQLWIDAHNPAMTLNEFYGTSVIAGEQYPILPITLPFESKSPARKSVLEGGLRHRVRVQLSYHGVDLDEELDTLEIDYEAPTAAVAGKRFTLSYRPATAKDEELLRSYDGRLAGTPCYLVHMYPQLKLEGRIVDENSNAGYEGEPVDNAAISMGLDETLRVKMLKPGEASFGASVFSDYKITVGDHVAIVPGLGSTPKEHLLAGQKRMEAAIAEQSQDLDRLIGEQLHITGSAYFYQADAYNDLLARQAGVLWLRRPSELTVSRHLDVDWLMDMFPIAIKSSTVYIDAGGNRYQAVPKQDNQWNSRVAFLKAAGVYSSMFEHVVLTELFRQRAVSTVKLIDLAQKAGIPLYEITPATRDSVLPQLHLSNYDINIINRELDLGQTVIAPARPVSFDEYSGAGIISTTPVTNPMAGMREGYFISRGANGGQISELLKALMNDFVEPNYMDWFQFDKSSSDSIDAVITNSDSIRDGHLQVRDMLNGLTGMAMAVWMPQMLGGNMNLGLYAGAVTGMATKGMDDFLGGMWVVYIDFEGNNLYDMQANNGWRTVKYVVLDILGQGKAGITAALDLSFRREGFAPDNVTATNSQGVGTFTFKLPEVSQPPEAGEQIIANLSLTSPSGKPVTTRGTFLVAGCAIQGLFPSDDTDLPVKPGKAAEIKADLLWDTQEIEWSYELVHEKKGEVHVTVEFDGHSCYITAAEDTGIGKVLLMAKDPQNPDCYKKIVVPIGCDSCTKCRQRGHCDPAVACIDARFSLGKADSGKPAGDIFLLSDNLTADLATPKGLIASALSPDVEVVNRNGAPRQVSAPEVFVDIKILSDYAYELRFYSPSDKGEKVNGLYKISLTAEPLNIWRVENPDASKTVFSRLNVTENLEGEVHVFEYAFDAASSTWSLVKGGGLQKISRQETWDNDTKNSTVIETVQSEGGPAASRLKTVTHRFAWGSEVIERVEDPAGAALTSTMTYYENKADTGNYSHLKTRVNSDNSQVSYEYDNLGRKKKETRNYLDGSSSRVTEYAYAPVDSGDTNALRDKYSPRCVIEKIAGSSAAKNYYACKTNGSGERVEITERCSTTAAAFGNSANERTVRTYFKSGTGLAGAGRIKNVQYADGRLDTYSYESGTAMPQGLFTAGQGTAMRSTVVHATITTPTGIAGKSTKDVSIADTFGRELRRETYAKVGGSWQLAQWTATAYDANGRPTSTTNSDGTITESVWNCCGKTSDTDARGIITSYTYDDLKRVISQTTEGPLGPVTTSYTYDAAGRRLGQTVTAGGITQSTANMYDGAGRLLTSTDAQNLTTSYSYAQNGLVTTVTRPGGATEITERYADGMVKSITGTGVIARYYQYSVNTDGSQWTKVSTGLENSPLWEKSTTDLLGRIIATEKPGYTGTEVVANQYDAKGRLVRTATTGMADMLYEYDELGNQERTGLDVNGNGALDPSVDRINMSSVSYVSSNGSLWQQAEQRVYADTGTPATVATQMARLTGLGAGGLAAETVSIDINGNRAVNKAFIDRASKTETRMVDYPDSTIDEQMVSVAGVVTATRSKTGIEITFTYDAFGRRTGSTDPRTGTAVTKYDEKGRVEYVADAAGNKTTYVYDDATGRKKAEINADGKYTRYAYNTQGQITATWGDAAYPVSYEYDTYGRLSKMYTYRTGEGWNGETFSGGAAGDATTWQYHEATGLLTAKIDAAGKAVSYTYGAAGRLATRTWARTDSGSPLATTYSYDPKTGELTGIDYSDTTSDVGFTYDRLGRQKKITDAIGSRSFIYGANLQLTAETITGMDNATITRSYDGMGRAGGASLGSDYSVTYGYDTATGRFSNVGWTAGGVSGAMSYSYVAASDLLQGATTGTGLSTTYAYESNRNLRNQVKNQFNENLLSQYQYSYDKLGRRSNVANTGTAFSNAAFNQFGYNDRSELTGYNRFLGTDTGSTSNPVTSEARAYAYDPIGNRTTATEATRSLTYTANQLNQYQLISDNVGWASPTVFDADGNLTSAPAGAVLVGWVQPTVLKYDAENRLISVAPETPVDGTTKVDYVYDYMSRRAQKKVSTFTSGSWSLTSTTTFIYDGWNLVKEQSTINNQPSTSYYVWGLDLSGSLQGAGGIGGLLARVKDTSVQQYTYDGNGNVSELVDSNGNITAHYEYDPYGNLIKADGALAQDNPFRFSTKYTESETGLVYYGYRYYSPLLGRWLNRDPIGEDAFFSQYTLKKSNNEINRLFKEGLKSPYLMVHNNAISRIDALGLCPMNKCNKWKLTIHTVGSAGEDAAVMIVGAQLDADRSCCMDSYVKNYSFEGGGLGIGLKYTFSVSGDGEWFETPCIGWDAHRGIGRATSIGFGLWWTWGALWVKTPQAYLTFTGAGRGFDLSGVTTFGLWILTDSVLEVR